MRRIEDIIKENPNLTGHQILEIQAKEEAEEKAKIEKWQAGKIAMIKDLNENGGFFKYKAGHQYGMYNITKAYLMGGAVYIDLQQIVLFDEYRENEFSAEVRVKTMQKEDTYALFDTTQRITKKEWEKVISSVNNLKNLW